MSEEKFTPGYDVTPDGRVFSLTSNWRGYGIRENPAIFEALDRLETESGYTMSMTGKRIRDMVK